MADINNEYGPDWVSPPGETLIETLNALGWSQVDLANRMGRSEERISEMIKGNEVITPDMALQLEQVLNVPARFWLNREQQYRLALAHQARGEAMKGSLD